MVLGKYQSGRSIIEMLGVLAIIGIMTVGGISIYSIAMQNKKVGEFVDFVVLAANNVSGFYRNYPTAAATKNVQTLCKFSLIPDNICDNGVETATTRTGYLGETLTLSVVVDASSQTGSVEITSVDGDTLYISRPHIVFNVGVSNLTSNAACRLILTNQIWSRVGKVSYVSGVGTLGDIQLPLSSDDAAKCDDAFTIKIITNHN